MIYLVIKQKINGFFKKITRNKFYFTIAIKQNRTDSGIREVKTIN